MGTVVQMAKPDALAKAAPTALTQLPATWPARLGLETLAAIGEYTGERTFGKPVAGKA